MTRRPRRPPRRPPQSRPQLLVGDLGREKVAAVDDGGAALAERAIDQQLAGQIGVEVGAALVEDAWHLIEAGDRGAHELGLGVQPPNEQREDAHEPGGHIRIGIALPPPPVARDRRSRQLGEHQVAIDALIGAEIVVGELAKAPSPLVLGRLPPGMSLGREVRHLVVVAVRSVKGRERW